MCNAHFYNLNITHTHKESTCNHKICVLKICMAFNCVHAQIDEKNHSIVVVIIVTSLPSLVCRWRHCSHTQTFIFSTLAPKSIFFVSFKTPWRIFHAIFTACVFVYACETANCSLLWIIYTNTHITMLAACTYSTRTWIYHAHSSWMNRAQTQKKNYTDGNNFWNCTIQRVKLAWILMLLFLFRFFIAQEEMDFVTSVVYWNCDCVADNRLAKWVWWARKCLFSIRTCMKCMNTLNLHVLT